MSNSIGIHAGVFVGEWNPSNTDLACRLAREAGFDTIEIPAFAAARLDVDATKSALERNGLTATCSLGLPFDANIASEDRASIERGMAYLTDAIAFAGAVGSRYVGGIIYGAFGRHIRPITAAERRSSIEAMRELASSANTAGVTLGLEIVNRYESNLLNTVSDGLAYIEDVGMDEVVLHLDTYHMNIEEDNPAEAVRLAGSRLGYLHVGASNRGGLAGGSFDLASIAEPLKAINYDGTITFESFSSVVLDPNLSNTLAIWRNTWDNSFEIASQARQTISDVFGA
ncbi:sugar phosphate isomerase/epimerase [Agreia pratensis]|uniref:sugar phosphate isomerase/epimerase family protein n=1 Tax=Microbacteriaceae TaxID=85023 RepID=UPI00188C0071|nr:MULTISPECIES: sugar phosphate isomerase/epimerase family protein [Microbacteriaceae]MBF4561229.1 sugar phosphate isomerase/epimerase [Microbacterium sp. VKM Ac-2870]MBF4633882.1 sugar phosphate isomerase/epimerase [Agreia pratensis]